MKTTKKEKKENKQIVEVHIYIHQVPCGSGTVTVPQTPPTIYPWNPYVTWYMNSGNGSSCTDGIQG